MFTIQENFKQQERHTKHFFYGKRLSNEKEELLRRDEEKQRLRDGEKERQKEAQKL